MGRAKSKRIKDFFRRIDHKVLSDQRKAAQTLVTNTKRDDALKKESVAMIDTAQAKEIMKNRFGDQLLKEAIPSVERGLVLEDAYGRGALQNGLFWR